MAPPSAGQIMALENREIDIGIVRSQHMPQLSDISSMKLLRDRLLVAMHRNTDRQLSPLGAGIVVHLETFDDMARPEERSDAAAGFP